MCSSAEPLRYAGPGAATSTTPTEQYAAGHRYFWLCALKNHRQFLTDNHDR